MKGRNDAQVGPINSPPFTIIALTRATEASVHTHQHARMIIAQQRRFSSSNQLICFDTKDENFSSMNPADSKTMQALTYLRLRQLIRQGTVFHEPTQHNNCHIYLKPCAKETLQAIDSQQITVYPLSWRYRLIRLIQTAPILSSSGHHKKPDDLIMTVNACKQCHMIFIGSHHCQNTPSQYRSYRLELRIEYHVQRLFWLSWKLKYLAIGRIHHTSMPTSILITEPKQLDQEISILISLLEKSGNHRLFHEICIWPSRQNKTIPAPGRSQFIAKLESKWHSISHFALVKSAMTSYPLQANRHQTIIDRWLLHTLNQTVGHVLKCEENHRPDQALEQLQHFINHRLSNNYILWRKPNWDYNAQHTLVTAIETINCLIEPYGINRVQMPGDLSYASTNHSLFIDPFKSEWVFAKEYKWVDTIDKISRLLSTLRRTVQKAGLTPDKRLLIVSAPHRRLPQDFIVLLQKIGDISQLELLTHRQSRTLNGLSAEIDSWKIILPLEDDMNRYIYRQYLQTQLNEESRDFNIQKEIYLQQKTSTTTSQASLAAMRKKLLQLKSKQMETMKRYHDIS